MKKFLAIVFLLAILFLGNFLRKSNYASVPHPGESADEYGFAWAGISLIEKKIPESWTTLEGLYPSYDYRIINVDNLYDHDKNKAPFVIVKPWFEKPPLFSLLIGGYSYLKGARLYETTSTAIIRLPMLKIAPLTTVLIFWLASRFYGYKIGLLSAFLYSIIPTFLISSRMALSENGYIPLFLGAVISADYFLGKKERKYLVLAGLFAALGILFKIPALAILLSLILIFLRRLNFRKNIKNILTPILICISAVLLYFAYGYVLDWETFINVLSSQNNYFYGAGSESFSSVLVGSKVALKYLTDGWILLAWMAAFYVGATEWKQNKGGTILVLCLFSYLMTFLYFGGEAYGWYRYPFFPFLVIVLARVIYLLWEKRSVYLFAVLSLIPFGTGFHRIFGQIGFQSIVVPFRIFLISLGLLFAVRLISKDKWVTVAERIFMVLIFSILIYISIKEILYLNYDRWFFVT